MAELQVLMAACSDQTIRDVLEVGHYFGLSTCAIVHGLLQRGGDWKMVSVDAHIADPWVNIPASIDDFERNRATHFADDRLTILYERSETISRIAADFVFYDGDHGDEQLRFTRAVIASPNVRTFVFDDRDFDAPRACCEELISAGWIDQSPPLLRLGGDKMAEETQTLGWFRRPC